MWPFLSKEEKEEKRKQKEYQKKQDGIARYYEQFNKVTAQQNNCDHTFTEKHNDDLCLQWEECTQCHTRR